MFKFGLCALAGILLASAAVCDQNETFLDSVGDFVFHFPRYLEEALSFDDELLENGTNNTNYLFANGSCSRDLLRIFAGLKQKNLWAIRVFDSWGKLPSGILSGNMYEFGDFDECLKIKVPNTFDPQYCLARVSKEELLLPNQNAIQNGLRSLQSFGGLFHDFDNNKPQPRIVPTTSNMLGLNFGICLPKSCTPEKVSKLFATIQRRIFKNKAVLAIVPDTCQVPEDQQWNFDTADWITLAFLVFIFVIMLSSTIYDLVQTRREREKSNLFIAFSMYTNGQKIFACRKSKSEHTMNCLNGMRVFSALWVIYAHAHALTIIAPTFNFAYIPEWASHYSTTVLFLAPFSVDTFLFLSGLLVTWSTLKHLNKTKGSINFAMVYVHRYLRLTPILAVVILISLTLFRRMGSGPLWFSYIKNAVNCDEYWWTSLLYIQNYYNPDKICLAHTWYLSVDMQLFVFAPLASYLLYRLGNAIAAIVGVLVAVCVGWTYWLFVHFNLVNQFLNLKNDILETYKLTYFPSHVRMSPWLIGVLFGYMLFKLQGKEERWNKIRVVIHWTFAAVIFGVLAYFSYELQQIKHEATPIESGIYTSISRAMWGVFLCFVIYACVKGYGGPVDWFLSLPVWQPFARLTYAIYLIHMPLMVILSASMRRPFYFSDRNLVFKVFGDFVAATILSILASLALESPIVVIEKIIFGPRKRPASIPTVQRDEPTAPIQEST